MKKLLLTLLAAAVTLAAAAGGISSAAELAAFAEAVNAGGDIAAWQDERGEVHLKADIDMSGIKRFARIGNFEGVFDGEGHAILNWKTDGGLFRLVAEGSVVRNLVIAESCSMKVSDDGDDAHYAGFVADVNHGILERCENYGSIAHRSARSLHDNYVGGVCGMNKYVVIRCKNGGDISSAGSCPSLAPTAEPRMYLGGVLGGSLGRSLPGAFVAWCENTGRVGYSGAFIVSHIGGIVGYNMRVKTKFCINRGEIVSAARGVEEGSDRYCQEMAGGICGMAKGDVMCCDNFGSVTTRGHAYSLTAGICGSAHESLTVGDCDNFAPVTSTSTYQASVGGIVGLSGRPVVVSHCRNKGAVRFDGTSVDRRSTAGGIVGYNMRVKTKFCINRGEIVSAARGVEEGSDRYCQEMAGGICGMAKGDVMCCDNFGSVTTRGHAYSLTAGICGSAHESLTVGDCDNFAPVTSTSTYQASVGGIVGLSGRPVVVSHCRNKGAVRFDGTSVDRRSTAGGIVGDIYAKRDAVYAASVRDCRNEGDVSCGLGENTRNSARGIQAAGIVGFINGNEAVSADVRDCVNTGRVRSESGRAGGICGFASYCDFAGNENLGSVEGGGALLGGIVAAFENGSVRGCTNRGDVLAGSKGQAGGIAATTWNGGNSRIESCRNGGVVKGMFGLAGSILGEGRTESDRVASCGVGGGVGTAAQGRDAAPKAAPENFDQFITGRNVVKNKAVVDRASCYYWDGNN